MLRDVNKWFSPGVFEIPKRFVSGKKIIKKFFPPTIVNREYHIPLTILAPTLFKYCIRYPVTMVAYIIIVLAIFGIGKINPMKPTGMLMPSPSSKKI